MEPSSIITQVSRDEENFRNTEDNNNSSPTRLNKPRSLLRSLLCCFGAHRLSQSRRRSSQNSHCGNNDAIGASCVVDRSAAILPPPPSSDTNGHILGAVNGGGLAAGAGGSLLPPVLHQDMGKICIVIDLDETLVHSSFKPISNADFIVPVEIDGSVHQVYVLKRPHVDHFLQQVGRLFECVLFTASLAKYADPVADLLDKHRVFRSRLFRESCVYYRGNYVKDLQRLGRNVRRVVIVDNSPASYIFHPDNAVAVKSWFDDMSDTELLDCLPLLERVSRAADVYSGLGSAGDSDATIVTHADNAAVS